MREFEIADGVKMKFRWIPRSREEFIIGPPDAEAGRVPKKKDKYIEKTGFWMGQHPVTQRQWIAVIPGFEPFAMHKNNFNIGNDIFRRKAAEMPSEDLQRLPAEQMSYTLNKDGEAGIKVFIERVNERTGAATTFGTNGRFSLPSEKRWEYAYRGGSGNDRPYYWGDTITPEYANYSKNIGFPTVVGRYAGDSNRPKPADHPWGLWDMSGNVWQFCEPSPNAPKDTLYLRGGSWFDGPDDCRATSRKRVASLYEQVNNTHGFRICFCPPE